MLHGNAFGIRSHITLGKGASPRCIPVGRDPLGCMPAFMEARDSMSEAPNPRSRHAAPVRGRRRVADAKNSFISVRCTAAERVKIDEAARRGGLSVGAYLRTLALGNPGPRAVRRPPIERRELARLLGHIGKIGSNVNQLARAFNRTGNAPGAATLAYIRDDIGGMRDALMTALGRDH
jgi:hypothetical protein